ncbi:ATP-dependent Clp protease proteolytic subunit [Gemmobacter lanyuensis]|nr:ATP-dependent Clp protease proteolytic subunit [Gemmobacter lanyuensis]
MLKIVPAVILLGLIVGCGPQAARAADIQIFADPAIPELSGNYLIHIDGLIEDGDADKLEAVVADLPKGRDNFLLVALNSPGGNLAEGLRMADVLQAAEIQVVTDVMGFGGTPADCASACSLVYLGGTYRYLQEGSRLGVHQFAFETDDIAAKSETTRQVQRMAANITDLLSRAYVDPGFFTLMGKTAPEDINWVDAETLRKLNVLNRERVYQENDFNLNDGRMSLVMSSVGMFGIHRLTASCENGTLAFLSETGVSEARTALTADMSGEQIASEFEFRILAQGYRTPPAKHLTQGYEEDFVFSSFSLDEITLSALSTAQTMDVRLVRENGLFLGSKFDLRDGRLSELISDCSGIVGQHPSILGGKPDNEESLSPVYAASYLLAVSEASPKSPVAQGDLTLEEEALARYLRYLEEWSLPNAEALTAMEAFYFPELYFYGKTLSREELMDEKRTFAERWPVRQYTAQPEGMEIRCLESGCLVAAFVNWEAFSPERNKSASGVAWYGLGFDARTGLIVLEDGKSQKR